jgi:hypothetical protein
MLERRVREFALLEARYGELEHGPNGEWVIVKGWLLPVGWNKPATSVLVQIPPGYPVTPPDNFYTDNDLRLASGTDPGNTSGNQSPIDSRRWRMFSYHVEGSDWHPHADVLQGHNLQTFFAGVEQRLREAS